MKRLLISIFTAIALIAAPMSASAAAFSPLSQFAACAAPAQRILNFPAWYNKLTCDASGKPTIKNLNDFWIIALNIIEWLIIGAAYAAAGFIMWGGFKYIKSRGDPGKTAEAKTAIVQAVIGLGITLGAVAIVEFVTGTIQTV